jgi:hypothetical protein
MGVKGDCMSLSMITVKYIIRQTDK